MWSFELIFRAEKKNDFLSNTNQIVRVYEMIYIDTVLKIFLIIILHNLIYYITHIETLFSFVCVPHCLLIGTDRSTFKIIMQHTHTHTLRNPFHCCPEFTK